MNVVHEYLCLSFYSFAVALEFEIIGFLCNLFFLSHLKIYKFFLLKVDVTNILK